MSEEIKKLSDVDRLDNRSLLEDLTIYLTGREKELRIAIGDTIFRNKLKGERQAVENLLNWIRDYEYQRQANLTKLKDFMHEAFPDNFISLAPVLYPDTYDGTRVYQAKFAMVKFNGKGVRMMSDDDCADLRKRIIKIVLLINEESFPNGDYAVMPNICEDPDGF